MSAKLVKKRENTKMAILFMSITRQSPFPDQNTATSVRFRKTRTKRPEISRISDHRTFIFKFANFTRANATYWLSVGSIRNNDKCAI